MLSGCGGGEDLHGVLAGFHRFLDHDHGVGAGRQRRAGRNLGARTARDRCLRQLSRVDALDNAQARRRRAGRARRVGGDDGVAVHGRARERRHVDVRAHIRGSNPTGSVGEGDALGAIDRDDGVTQMLARIVE